MACVQTCPLVPAPDLSVVSTALPLLSAGLVLFRRWRGEGGGGEGGGGKGGRREGGRREGGEPRWLSGVGR